MNAYIVVIDNGDTEPELWAFKEEEDADAFVDARGGGNVISVAVMGHGEARQCIAQELEGP